VVSRESSRVLLRSVEYTRNKNGPDSHPARFSSYLASAIVHNRADAIGARRDQQV
jgi:hypothetical protein